MALSDADKTEMTELFSNAMALGLAKFRSAAEEEEAKKGSTDAGNTDANKGGNSGDSDGDSGFSLAGFILGR